VLNDSRKTVNDESVRMRHKMVTIYFKVFTWRDCGKQISMQNGY
jgi:hypothetical protein